MRLDGEIRIERRPRPARHTLSLLRHVYVERGTKEDWDQLHELHYKSSNLGIGPRFMRCVLDTGESKPEVIGVMVFTVPKPLDSGRNQVFPHMRPNRNGRDTRFVNQARMKWLNENILLSSRTVLDTMYRGAGIAYRFKNIGYRMMGYRFIESRSSMSRYNPFSIKAGMKFVAPKAASAYDQGLEFFAKWFDTPGYDFVGIKQELARMPEAVRTATELALRAFYYKHSAMEKSGEKRLIGTSRVDKLDIGYVIKGVQQLVFGATVYAIWANPDWDPAAQAMRPLPARVPLLAFDNQAVDAPLRLDLLEPA